MSRIILLIGLCLVPVSQAAAQIVVPATIQPTVTLRDQLINRLRATTPERQAFIDHVIKQVTEQKLDLRLVIAVERYSIRRNRAFPFPFFERAIRIEAAKRGVALPAVQTFIGTQIVN